MNVALKQQLERGEREQELAARETCHCSISFCMLSRDKRSLNLVLVPHKGAKGQMARLLRSGAPAPLRSKRGAKAP